MSKVQQARRRVSDLARRAGRRAVRTRLGRRLRRPTVTVVVPFYNVEKYFADCLDSVLRQTYVDFEAILVDDGSLDGSRAIAEQYVARDARLRLVTRPNGGLGAARNTGIRHARGRYLTFLDSDDELTDDALAALVRSARRTGSEIVVGAVERFDSTAQWNPPWTNEVHRVQRDRLRLEDFLPLVRNLYTWNKLYDRAFFLDQGLWFREGVAYEDQPIVTQLLVAAGAIDVIPDVVYRYRMRDDRSSISQQTATVKDLRDRVLAWEISEAALQSVPRAVRDAWLQTLLDAHFGWYLTSPGTVDDEYWELIHEAVVRRTRDVPQAVWDTVAPQNRVLLELARQGRRADVQEFVRLEAPQRHELFASQVRRDGILLELPFLGDDRLDDELFLLRPEQLQAYHGVDRLEWDSDRLLVRGHAFIRKLDLAEHTSHVDLVLTGVTTGRQRVFPAVDGVPPPPLTDFLEEWCDHHRRGFEVVVPTAEILDGGEDGAGAGDEAWDVSLRVSAAGFVVATPVSALIRSGSAGALESGRLADGRRLVPVWRYRHPLRLSVAPAGVDAVDVALHGRRLSGRLAGRGSGGPPRDIRLVEIHGPAGSRSVRPRDDGGFEIEVPTVRRVRSGSPVTLAVRAVDAEGGELVVQPAPATTGLPVVETVAGSGDGAVTLVALRDRHGDLVIEQWTHGVVAESVETTPQGGLRVTGRVHGPGVTAVRLCSVSPKANAEGDPVGVADGRFVAELDLRHQAYRFGRLPLPADEHQLRVRLESAGGPVEVPLAIGVDVNRQLPVTVDTDVHEGHVTRGPAGALQVKLVRPLGYDQPNYVVSRLRREAAAAATGRRGGSARRGVLFRSYFGERATDNGVAIAEELARRGSDLPVYWAVQDHSVPVPGEGIPVVVNSPEWFDLLGSVRYYVDNMYQPDYHHKPDGQVIVQTFHGYPFKQMGMPHWQHQQFSRAKIESYLRRSAEWDHLVSPATYATPHLTRDFHYDGDVLEIGYPRNDVLQSPDADRIRRETRTALGLRDDQVAVLYAPTFRDYLLKRGERAAMSDFLDFDELARELGDDVVILMRGHAFHARTRHRVGNVGTTIDVTDYPEVSDLYLAADVGVVDYSSLRFDFGVTGKPMIFLVPDLQRYVETRGWLFDFEPTAPGPLVSTTAEVVEQLRDLDRLRAEHAEDYERFRTTYLDLEDGRAAARFVDAVFAPRGDA